MKLSSIQMFWLFVCFQTGNTILITFRSAIQIAKQDAWLSFTLAFIVGMFLLYIALKSVIPYVNDHWVKMSKLIFGNIFGLIIILIYLFQWFFTIPIILHDSSDFLNTILLNKTPNWILTLTMLVLVIYLLYAGGVLGIGRCSEVFGPLIILSTWLFVVLAFKDFNFRYVLPIYADTGFRKIVEGSLLPFSFIGESIIFMMFFTFTNDPKKSLKGAMWGVFISTLTSGLILLSVIFTFGAELSASMLFSAFDMVSYISIMNFIQNLEILFVLIWIFSIFIKISVYFFITCYTLAKLFKVKKWKNLIWIITPIFFLCYLYIPNIAYTTKIANTVWVYVFLPVNMVLIPLLLWGIRKWRKDKELSIE